MLDLVPLWPLFGLRLSTPRLELTPVGDGDLAELVAVARAGIHPPERMPFGVPWTLAAPQDLGPQTLQYFWRLRAELRPDRWQLPFVVRHEGVLVGVQDVKADGFAVPRTISTGSWLGRQFQGRGIGTEMRAAVLAFAFDQLGARRAESSAFADNPVSQAVSAKLGYADNGTQLLDRDGEAAVNVRFVVTPASFVRPSWTLGLQGLGAALAQLGISRPA